MTLFFDILHDIVQVGHYSIEGNTKIMELRKMNIKNINTRILVVCILMVYGEHFSFSQSPIPQGTVLEKLRTGFLQPEGPVWKNGVGILFSDIQANKIYRWSPVDSSLVSYLSPSDSSNGLTFDQQGCLILTQMEKRRVSRQELNGTITPLASTYNGKKFNSPNDVVVKSDGSIFFTDPDFNIPGNQKKELTFQGIYRISSSGTLSLLDSSLNKPNGICFSLDEKKLFVNESAQGKIYVWDVMNDSTISNKKLFYTIPLGGYADGMKIDPNGNIYCTGPTGVWIISPSGVYLDKIVMTETPSNCAWGDADRKSLYITAGKSLYRVRLVTTGIENEPVRQSPVKSELLQNYPNPFNPQTTIMYRVSQLSMISLKVFDVLGREVSVLSEQEVNGGTYSATFDGKQLTSGIYIAQLKITSTLDHSSSVQTKKLLLLK
jgi:gluconolactonase